MQKPGRLDFMARAFRYRNYRLFFGGQFVSLIGTWMSSTASSWLVYRLTGSAFLLGVVGFAGQFPAFLLAPVAGVFVDRWDKRKILILCQALSMLQSFALAGLILTGNITYTAIILLNVFQGLVTAFDMPCRQSFVILLIEEKENLGNAIALNSSMFNAARLLGPSIAGIVIAVSNEGWCFLIDGVSYLAVLAALFAMKMKPIPAWTQSESGAFKQLREGWRYAFGFVPIRDIIMLLALVSLVGIPYSVLMPVFAKNILHGGPHTLGFLMAASGGGSLLGALWLSSRKNVLGLGRAIPIATAFFGAGLIAFSVSRLQWLSILCMLVTGGGFMIHMAASNTILQTIVDDDKRGRVMSLFIMAFLGTAPIGALLAGSLGDRIGAPDTLLIGGLSCLAGAAWFAWKLPAIRQAVRPIYIKMGILPEVTAGLQNVARLTLPPDD